MAINKKQDYFCALVSEGVQISLRKKPSGGLRSRSEFFVQCDQSECQHVDENVPPCPLTLALFKQEIEQHEEAVQQQREDNQHF